MKKLLILVLVLSMASAALAQPIVVSHPTWQNQINPLSRTVTEYGNITIATADSFSTANSNLQRLTVDFQTITTNGTPWTTDSTLADYYWHSGTAESANVGHRTYITAASPYGKILVNDTGNQSSGTQCMAYRNGTGTMGIWSTDYYGGGASAPAYGMGMMLKGIVDTVTIEFRAAANSLKGAPYEPAGTLLASYSIAASDDWIWVGYLSDTRNVASMSLQGTNGIGCSQFYVDDLTHLLAPEPMTIALLGLGGLFLRRRK